MEEKLKALIDRLETVVLRAEASGSTQPSQPTASANSSPLMAEW